MGLDHGRSAMGLVLWWWLLGARLECKIAREIQQHVLRVGLVSYCCGLTLISTFPYPNFWSFLHNQTETEWKEGKKKKKIWVTLKLVEVDVLDVKMVSVEALTRIVIERKAFLELGEEDSSLDTGICILETLQDQSEGSVGIVSLLRTLLQELIHRSHFNDERILPQLLLDF